MTLTAVGAKQHTMSKSSESPRSNLKTTKKKITNSVPVLPPRSVPELSPAIASVTGNSRRSSPSGISAAPITLRGAAGNINTSTCRSIGMSDCINHPMNNVNNTPEPYLEPIKLLNKQSTEESQQSPAAAPVSIGVPAEKTVTSKPQLTRRKFATASSPRPIPPPKVLLSRQKSVKEEVHLVQRSKDKTNNFLPERKTSAKRRELAYLIVDLPSGRSAISTKNIRALGKLLKRSKNRCRHVLHRAPTPNPVKL